LRWLKHFPCGPCALPPAAAYLRLVRPMTSRVIVTGSVIAGLVLMSSCASRRVGVEGLPPSEPEISALLVGRWHESDFVMPSATESYRFELTFAADGTCAYYFVPAIPGRPLRVTRGTWRVDGRRLVFEWGRHSFPSHPLVQSGRITRLDHDELRVSHDPGERGWQQFYRSYDRSISRMPSLTNR